MEYLVPLWPLFLIFAAIAALVVWLGRRSERKHTDALAALANKLGGSVAASGAESAWSTEFQAPLANDTSGLVNRLNTVSRPRFTTALDFQRGSWHVRVTEASMKKSTATGSTTHYEHRIEVATSQLTPLKIFYHQNTEIPRFLKKPNRDSAQTPGWVDEPPLTVARKQAQWLRLTLPPTVDSEFIVFTSDLAAATRMFNPQAAEWLLSQANSLPLLYKMFLRLTFESGFVYATAPRRIDPEELVPMIDTIIGLLDRIPGAAPRHPAASI